MNSKGNNPLQKTIPFEEPSEMEEQKALVEADAQVAVNMVVDLKRDMQIGEARRRQATYWRFFAGIVLIVVVVLSLMNLQSRTKETTALHNLIEAVPFTLNESVVVKNNELHDLRLADLETSLFFYQMIKADFERRIRLAQNGGPALSLLLISNMESFNARARANDWDPVLISPPPISP